MRIGGADVLDSMRTIRLAVCNTVMTAHLILNLAAREVRGEGMSSLCFLQRFGMQGDSVRGFQESSDVDSARVVAVRDARG